MGIITVVKRFLGNDKVLLANDRHACPHCGDPDKLELVWGGIRRRQGRFIGKMGIACTGCGKHHTFRGKDREAIKLYAALVHKMGGIRHVKMTRFGTGRESMLARELTH